MNEDMHYAGEICTIYLGQSYNAVFHSSEDILVTLIEPMGPDYWKVRIIDEKDRELIRENLGIDATDGIVGVRNEALIHVDNDEFGELLDELLE